MSKKKTVTGWLAIGSDGEWSLAGWDSAQDPHSSGGDAAAIAIEGTEDSEVHSLHKVTFELPDSPKVQGEDVAAMVGKAEKT